MTVSLAGGIGTSPLSRCGEALVASGCQVKVGWTGWMAVCRCWAWGRFLGHPIKLVLQRALRVR